MYNQILILREMYFLLEKGKMTTSSKYIKNRLGLTLPTVSKELKQLQSGGIISRKRKGKFIIYSLTVKGQSLVNRLNDANQIYKIW